MPKLLVLGHKRHGKDTVCGMLSQMYGFSFVSSSMFCAKEIVMPYLAQHGVTYETAEACFLDRNEHRKEWYDAISEYNKDDATRLGRAIFSRYDIYCGLRNVREANALEKERIYDLAIWVDSSRRGVPPESSDSCTVTSANAHVIVDNGSTLADLSIRLDHVMTTYFPSLKKLTPLSAEPTCEVRDAEIKCYTCGAKHTLSNHLLQMDIYVCCDCFDDAFFNWKEDAWNKIGTFRVETYTCDEKDVQCYYCTKTIDTCSKGLSAFLAFCTQDCLLRLQTCLQAEVIKKNGVHKIITH